MGPELLPQPCLGHSCLPRHASPPPTLHKHTFYTLLQHSNTHSHDPLTKRRSAPKETQQKFLIDLEIERGFLPPLVSFFNIFVSRGSRPPLWLRGVEAGTGIRAFFCLRFTLHLPPRPSGTVTKS